MDDLDDYSHQLRVAEHNMRKFRKPGPPLSAECIDCIDCAVCGREMPPVHRHHTIWADGVVRRGVCEGCAD